MMVVVVSDAVTDVVLRDLQPAPGATSVTATQAPQKMRTQCACLTVLLLSQSHEGPPSKLTPATAEQPPHLLRLALAKPARSQPAERVCARTTRGACHRENDRICFRGLPPHDLLPHGSPHLPPRRSG